ncbi:hypothetical protein [Psychroserpens sp. NJDZ02]|uniref:hypothetical protein n=1 Tax=Psychroserpens sp. NJDZ02 TaxID=2570561 RepID=UPI0010A81454|nr:hypothetical protein [Psychroserpens sp. NJDZ02]QCE40374.1 hypothetical protein E9099_02740 [Psychroserpens sp. NJDZ02]
MKKINSKRVFLLITVFALFLLGLFFAGIFTLGMGKGYTSAIIENTIKKQCKCTIVESIQLQLKESMLVDQEKMKKHTNAFMFILSNCDYPSISDLKLEVIRLLVKARICEDYNFQFIVKNFNGQDQRFIIDNCNLIEN